jgi:hypothetical protein
MSKDVFLMSSNKCIPEKENNINYYSVKYYRAFYRFGQAKFAYVGLISSSSQFTLLPQLPPKMMLDLKMV